MVYHYRPGAASWYMMTVITQVFGVRGEGGDLTVDPKLVLEQFDESNRAAITFNFAGRNFHVTIANLSNRDYGQYHIGKAHLFSPVHPQVQKIPVTDGKAVLARQEVLRLPDGDNIIMIELI